MKKEFIVSKIETAPEESAYVYVILTDTGIHFSPTRRQQNFPENPFGIAPSNYIVRRFKEFTKKDI